jgi:hypothetical protein
MEMQQSVENEPCDNVWSPGVYPCSKGSVLQQKKDFGIAISGGGMRAACCGHGWLQALNNCESSLFLEARYLSVNSGGSWIAMPLLWQVLSKIDDNIDETATVTTTEEARIALKQQISRHLQLVLELRLQYRFKDSLVYRLGSWKGVVHRMLDRIAGVSHGDYLTYSVSERAKLVAKQLPYLIVNGSIFVTSEDTKDRGRIKFAPFEFTPCYCGVPLDPITLDSGFKNYGGLVSRKVFGTDYSADGINRGVHECHTENGRTHTVRVYDPAAQFNTTTIAAISSSAIVEGFYERPRTSIFCSRIARCIVDRMTIRNQYWAYNEHKQCDQKNLMGGEVAFADGGATDNTGILALLRRQVKEVLALGAILIDINEPNDDRLMECLFDYMSLFGRVTQHVTDRGLLEDWDAYNRQRRVFKPDLWDQLLAGLRRQRASGDSLSFTFCSIEVLENKFCGVPAYEANITFVFNGRCDKFSNISDGRGVDNRFPFIPTEKLYYSVALTNAFSSLSAWALNGGGQTVIQELCKRLKQQVDVAAEGVADDINVKFWEDTQPFTECACTPSSAGNDTVEAHIQSAEGQATKSSLGRVQTSFDGD